MTSDGTLANLTAVMVEREKAFLPEGDFPGILMAGVDWALKYYGFQRGTGRTKVIAMVGIAGTTETNNVDDLAALAEASREAGAHFHVVDACWGGSALLVDKYRPMFKGIEEADSVSIDALNIKLHKAPRMDDSTFVSRTMLESTIYRAQNIIVLRAVLANPLTDRNTLKEVVDTKNRIGLEIWSEFDPAYSRAVYRIPEFHILQKGVQNGKNVWCPL